ncbi:hypothetical protein L1987_28973 [Smallanthus sonchifolius]|uniref:Uncharacterized protein n=1 Tax=Smallanthus sonchifolius TaxID=185202 RepID=A0ACB9HY66_9ASTR|nr:hypothetical protein L1987_28973 [Smallanthus sonchifolius]
MAISRCIFANLQKPQVELDGKACGAIGQNGLMALYDTLFSQVSVSQFRKFLSFRIPLVFIVLLSDVNGLYSGPPTNMRSKLIYTYVKQKPQKAIIFGDKSRMGRGGMDSKVKAASNAAYSGFQEGSTPST